MCNQVSKQCWQKLCLHFRVFLDVKVWKQIWHFWSWSLCSPEAFTLLLFLFSLGVATDLRFPSKLRLFSCCVGSSRLWATEYTGVSWNLLRFLFIEWGWLVFLKIKTISLHVLITISTLLWLRKITECSYSHETI